MPRHPDHPDHFTMSFGDHLEELRRRLLFALAVPIPISIVTFLFSDTLISWLLLPLYDVLAAKGLSPEVQALSPPEMLVTKIKLSIISAVIFSAPWLLWQLWRFIAPGLYGHERRFVYFLIPGSAILTAAGVALMYFVMLPLMLQVLVSIGADIRVSVDEDPIDEQARLVLEAEGEIDVVSVLPERPDPGGRWLLVPQLDTYVSLVDQDGAVIVHRVPEERTGAIGQSFRVSYIVSFVLILMLGIAIAFQMPLVIVLLGWLGIVSPQWLRANRKYALFVCGGLAAVITPADVISMLAMLVPLYGLYELGILLLIIAPSSAVAEGRIWPWQRHAAERTTDKPLPKSSQTEEPAQPDRTVARGDATQQSDGPPSDGDGAG